MCTGWPCNHSSQTLETHIKNYLICLQAYTRCVLLLNDLSPPCPVKASEALVQVSGDMLWMGNSAPEIGGAVFLTSHAQLRLNPSANLTFVANSGR